VDKKLSQKEVKISIFPSDTKATNVSSSKNKQDHLI
jgi:hypothetical protein